MSRKKPRPASAGPRKRRYSGGGRGRPFKPGTNSQTGAVFRRGPDLVPRGTMTVLYEALFNDDGNLAQELLAIPEGAKVPLRTALARSLLLSAHDPARALGVAETIADRLEGRPVQKVSTEGSHLTSFYKAGDPPPPLLKRAETTSRSRVGS